MTASRNSATQPRISRQSERSETTRQALLAAARKVFARDGFEASRIDDIAAEAGRSRGAFYANFANKAAAFFALRRQSISEYEAAMRRLQEENISDEEQCQIFTEWVAARIPEDAQILLQLEFKLYAIRHPEARRELLAQHVRKCGEASAEDGEAATEEKQRRMLLIESVIEGLVLNYRFSPELLTPETLHSSVRVLFGALMPERVDS